MDSALVSSLWISHDPHLSINRFPLNLRKSRRKSSRWGVESSEQTRPEAAVKRQLSLERRMPCRSSFAFFLPGVCRLTVASPVPWVCQLGPLFLVQDWKWCELTPHPREVLSACGPACRAPDSQGCANNYVPRREMWKPASGSQFWRKACSLFLMPHGYREWLGGGGTLGVPGWLAKIPARPPSTSLLLSCNTQLKSPDVPSFMVYRSSAQKPEILFPTPLDWIPLNLEL